MITWPACTAGRTSRPIGRTTCKIQFWYIDATGRTLLHSVAFSDVSRCGTKKRWWNLVDWQLRFGSFIQEGTPAGHNAGRVIIKYINTCIKWTQIIIAKYANFVKIVRFQRNFEKFYKRILNQICTKLLANFVEMRIFVDIFRKVGCNFHKTFKFFGVLLA